MILYTGQTFSSETFPEDPEEWSSFQLFFKSKRNAKTYCIDYNDDYKDIGELDWWNSITDIDKRIKL